MADGEHESNAQFQQHQIGDYFDVFAELRDADRFVCRYDRGFYPDGESAAADDRRSTAGVCLESEDSSEEEIFGGSMSSDWEEYLDCLTEPEDLSDGRRSDSENGGYEYDIVMHSDSDYDYEILDDEQNMLDDTDRFTGNLESGGLEEQIYGYDSGIDSNREANLESSSAVDDIQSRSTAGDGLESDNLSDYEGRYYSNLDKYLDCMVEAEERFNKRQSTGVGSESGGSSEEESTDSESETSEEYGDYYYNSGVGFQSGGSSEEERPEDDLDILAAGGEVLYDRDRSTAAFSFLDGRNILYDIDRFTAGLESGRFVEEIDEYHSVTWEEHHLDPMADAENFPNIRRFTGDVGLESGEHHLDPMADAENFPNIRQFTGDVGLESGGLSEEEISKHLKLITNTCGEGKDEDDGRLCAVCLNDLCQTDERIGVLQCSHEYHYYCIKKWLQRKNFCPLCKRVALTVS